MFCRAAKGAGRAQQLGGSPLRTQPSPSDSSEEPQPDWLTRLWAAGPSVWDAAGPWAGCSAAPAEPTAAALAEQAPQHVQSHG